MEYVIFCRILFFLVKEFFMESIFIPRYFWNGTNDEVCTNTAVLVRDNRIEQIDEPEKLRLDYPEAQVLESKDWLMMPAFVDAHDHGRGMSPISFRTPDRALEIGYRI